MRAANAHPKMLHEKRNAVKPIFVMYTTTSNFSVVAGKLVHDA